MKKTLLLCFLLASCLLMPDVLGDGQLKKLSICYTTAINDPDNQEFLANNFDMISCGKSGSIPDSVSNIKALNPDMIAFGYYDTIYENTYYEDWDYVDQHEDWFVHAQNEDRIYVQQPSYRMYLMKPGSGWSSYYAAKSVDFLDQNPQYDGIFADDAALDFYNGGYCSAPFNHPCEEMELWDDENGYMKDWNDEEPVGSNLMYNHLSGLQSEIGSGLVMPNSWKYTVFSEDITGIHLWENFVHGKIHGIYEPGYGEFYTIFAIDALRSQAERGNIIAVVSGTSNPESDPQEAAKILNFTLACFLFAVEDMGKSYYAWNFFGDDSGNGYYPVMDHQFGNPVGGYYNVQGSVYAREFENAIVVAGISADETESVFINGTLYEINPRTGLIIEKGGSSSTSSTVATTSSTSSTTTSVSTTTTLSESTTTTTGGGGGGGGGGSGVGYNKKEEDYDLLSSFFSAISGLMEKISTMFGYGEQKTWKWSGE